MNTADKIYLICLTISIIFSLFYRKIRNKVAKKFIGTVAGILLVSAVSGIHIIHHLIVFFINSAIIIKLHHNCFNLSFVCSFCYLLFFRTTGYFNLSTPTPHANLVQMILTLKIVGLAAETEKLGYNNLGFVQILHYCFNYIGIISGPYYRYQTFEDYFKLPYSSKSELNGEFYKKLFDALIFSTITLSVSSIWPISYLTSDQFYSETSRFYRYFYAFPVSLYALTRLLAGLALSESICIAANFGGYPTFMESKPGLGPIAVKQDDKTSITNSSKLDFNCVKSYNFVKSLFSRRIRRNITNWNMTVQFWFSENIYKRLKWQHRAIRGIVTIFVSSYWHGISAGYYICGAFVVTNILIEDFFYGFFTCVSRRIFWVNFVVIRLNITMAAIVVFVLQDFSKIARYFGSIFL